MSFERELLQLPLERHLFDVRAERQKTASAAGAAKIQAFTNSANFALCRFRADKGPFWAFEPLRSPTIPQTPRKFEERVLPFPSRVTACDAFLAFGSGHHHPPYFRPYFGVFSDRLAVHRLGLEGRDSGPNQGLRGAPYNHPYYGWPLC